MPQDPRYGVTGWKVMSRAIGNGGVQQEGTMVSPITQGLATDAKKMQGLAKTDMQGLATDAGS
jgi:hypothetical protein